MAKMTVWHLCEDRAEREARLDAQTGFDPGRQMAAVGALWGAGAYVATCEVAGDDPNTAYRKTQNGGPETDSWTLKPPEGLTPLLPPIEAEGRVWGRRSTMMGDVIEVPGRGRLVVARVGFASLA